MSINPNKMKVILSLSIAILVYFGSSLNLLNLVDFEGIYHPKNQSPKMINEVLELKSNGFFEYKLLYLDDFTSGIQTIKGKYTVQGNLLRFFPDSFKKNTEPIQAINKSSSIKTRGIPKQKRNSIIDKSSPKSFKQHLSTFESGASRLKPSYYFKQTKEKLSLCLKDLKTEQYKASFLRVD